MPADDRVCAVVVTYNRRELLRECLTAVRAQTRVLDALLVVDNASTDGTAQMVAEEFEDALLVRLDHNEGSAGGFHEGMRAALGSGFGWQWVMDDDTIPRPDALERLFAARERLDGLPDPVMLYSKVLWTDGRMHPMNFPGFRLTDPHLFASGVEQGLPPLRWATFPSLLLRSDALERHGPPRKRFFLWSDDIDFTARILRSEPGYFVPDSVAVHKTATAHWPWEGGDRFYFAVRNGLWILRGDALAPPEKIGHAILIAGQVCRFLPHERFRPSALGIVARGLRDGLLRRP